MKKVTLLALAALSSTVWAEPPARIDVSNLPAASKMIDDVVVPVPSEIFGVLDKLGKPNWTAVQHKSSAVAVPIGEQPQIALQLGTVIAEGFIAVEAQDATEVKQIGKSVLKLADALGVGKQVKARAQAITDAANANDWNGVRKELDRALEDVREAMKELNSESLSQLVSLGGWLRGTEALTAVVQNQYSKEGAELLHQPILLEYFEKRITNMKPKIKLNPVVGKVQKGIIEIRPFMGVPDTGDISEKSVKEIHAISSGLIKTINSKP